MLRGAFSAAAFKRKGGRARFEQAQGLGTDIPPSHTTYNLSLECPSQRNRPPSPRIARICAQVPLTFAACPNASVTRKARELRLPKAVPGLNSAPPPSHAASSLRLECPSHRNRPLRLRIAAQRVREL